MQVMGGGGTCGELRMKDGDDAMLVSKCEGTIRKDWGAWWGAEGRAGWDRR